MEISASLAPSLNQTTICVWTRPAARVREVPCTRLLSTDDMPDEPIGQQIKPKHRVAPSVSRLLDSDSGIAPVYEHDGTPGPWQSGKQREMECQ